LNVVQWLFLRFAELFVVLRDTIIFNNGGFVFTMWGLMITIFVVHLLIDIAIFFFEPKGRIRRYQSEQRRLSRRHKTL